MPAFLTASRIRLAASTQSTSLPPLWDPLFVVMKATRLRASTRGRSDASDSEVKSAYRKLAKEYHPDTLNRQGVSEELREFAREKMLAVNDAYQRVKEARGF